MIPSIPDHNSPLHISSTLDSVYYEFTYVTDTQKILKFFRWYIVPPQINEKLFEGKGSIKYFYSICLLLCVRVCAHSVASVVSDSCNPLDYSLPGYSVHGNF